MIFGRVFQFGTVSNREPSGVTIAGDVLFHPFGSLLAEGPGSEEVRGEGGEVQDHRGQESPDLAG
jgi:hypothetical protein